MRVVVWLMKSIVGGPSEYLRYGAAIKGFHCSARLLDTLPYETIEFGGTLLEPMLEREKHQVSAESWRCAEIPVYGTKGGVRPFREKSLGRGSDYVDYMDCT